MYQQASRMDRAIGELSYPIYITHMLVIWVLAAVLARNQIHLSALSKTMAAVLLTCAFAWVLNRTVSAKVERLRSRLGSQQ